MSRKPSINWRESDAERLEKEVRRFNAKIYRVRNRHPEMADILPDTIKKEDKQRMINEFKQQTRSNFDKEIRSLERFSRKGAEKEVVAESGNRVTRWEKKEVGYQVQEANREIAKRLKEASEVEATSRGEKIGLKRGEMGSERLNSLKPINYNFEQRRGGKEWEKFKAMVQHKRSPLWNKVVMDRYKENYLKGLDAFGGYADDIKAIVEKLPSFYVTHVYYAEQEATIDFYYEGLEGLQERDPVIETIREIWGKALENYESVYGRL